MKEFIIVTGGCGFVGSNLIEYLLKKTKNKIISIDDYSAGLKKNQIDNKRVKYIKGDTKDISKILAKYSSNIKVVFHFGEFSRIYQSFVHMDKCINSNTIGSNAVFNFCLKHKIKLIYSATSASLGNKGQDKNLSPYAFTKSKNLELLENLKKWFKFKYEVIFFYNVYGPGQIKNSKMSAVIGVFETLFEQKKPLTVVKPGNQKRDFTHIDDIVRGCYLVWKKGRQTEYMLGTKKQYKIYDIAKMFRTKIKFIPYRKGERFRSSITNDNAKNHLNYKAKIDIKDYIKDYIGKF